MIFDFWEKPTIKNCPCCDGEAYLHHENSGKTVWIQCVECGIQTPKCDDDDITRNFSALYKAFELWNRRTRE